MTLYEKLKDMPIMKIEKYFGGDICGRCPKLEECNALMEENDDLLFECRVSFEEYLSLEVEE